MCAGVGTETAPRNSAITGDCGVMAGGSEGGARPDGTATARFCLVATSQWTSVGRVAFRGPSRRPFTGKRGTDQTELESSRRDAGCHATVYWQSTPNSKNLTFRNWQISRTSIAGRIGVSHAISNSWARSRLFALAGGGVSPAISGRPKTPTLANPAIRAPNEQGPPVVADGPCGIETGCGTRLNGGGGLLKVSS